MKGFLKIKSNDRGMAIITVVLTTALILALFVMAFTNTMIGNVVTETNRRTRTVAECAHGDLALAGQILLEIDSSTGATALPAWVIMNGNLLPEIGGNIALANDNANTVPPPNLIITNPSFPGCVTNVDIDYTFHDLGADGGTAEEGVTMYQKSTGGTLCEPGDFYAITAITTFAGAVSQVESAYCKPPKSG